jgi:adenine-specific DNA-methyltransferase
MPRPKKNRIAEQVATYGHPEADNVMRPEVGTQAQFKKKKPPKTYRYDSSLSPALEWDGQNATREAGDALIRKVLEAKSLSEAKAAAAKLKAMSRPFLNWAGKAERLSFDVPTLPLFIHERLSTRAILETLKGHERDKQQTLELFGDPQRSIADQVLRAYEHRDKWVNRMILGDSLVVMNSLLHYEGLGGQVQMIYIDPPYGVKFGSNFQPFVRKRDVAHGDDDDLTREPEMVQAYRDTWDLGLHSYLTYLRDRLLLARDLLTPSGSVFVQISDENLHHVRELMDEVFGAENFCSQIYFQKTSYATAELTPAIGDYLLWYARDRATVKFRKLFVSSPPSEAELSQLYIELSDGTIRKVSIPEANQPSTFPPGAVLFQSRDLASAGAGSTTEPFTFEGRRFHPGPTRHWKTSRQGMDQLQKAGRLFAAENSLRYKRLVGDFPWTELVNVWNDTVVGSFHEAKVYVVQTSPKVIQRCLQMTTDPGDLVLDPTCGSGTTAYVAEEWGRRWITVDTSRVPLALARQRLLTATYPWYELTEDTRGPAGGFVYRRKQNKKGEEVGGIVPHVTLKSIANNEPPSQEVLVDRPDEVSAVTRVSGPFTVEASIPTPVDWEGDGVEDSGAKPAEEYSSFVERMLEVLRKSPILRLGGNRTVTFKNVRPPAKTLSLSAEALVDATAPGQKPTLKDAVIESEEKNANALPLSSKPVAFVFGPENGAVSEKLVFEAAREAHAKSYTHLYVIGFAIQPNAREMVDRCEEIAGVPATYVQATPDLLMGDLLKTMRSSQIFSVCGQPEIAPRRLKDGLWEVELLGFDVFDPVTMQPEHKSGDDVPAWLLDTDYNGMCFHVSQAFFPRTSAWESLKRALRTTYEESVWDHLAGTTSAPFKPGEHNTVAVKVIDDRGNELLVVRKLGEARK